MSLATKCDRCGNIIGSASSEPKEYFDAAIIINGEMAAEFEDLCPSCTRMLMSMVDSFREQPQNTITAMPKPSRATKHDKGNDEDVDTPKKEEKLPPKADGFVPYSTKSEKDMANGTVKSVSIKSRQGR